MPRHDPTALGGARALCESSLPCLSDPKPFRCSALCPRQTGCCTKPQDSWCIPYWQRTSPPLLSAPWVSSGMSSNDNEEFRDKKVVVRPPHSSLVVLARSLFRSARASIARTRRRNALVAGQTMCVRASRYDNAYQGVSNLCTTTTIAAHPLRLQDSRMHPQMVPRPEKRSEITRLVTFRM